MLVSTLIYRSYSFSADWNLYTTLVYLDGIVQVATLKLTIECQRLFEPVLVVAYSNWLAVVNILQCIEVSVRCPGTHAPVQDNTVVYYGLLTADYGYPGIFCSWFLSFGLDGRIDVGREIFGDRGLVDMPVLRLTQGITFLLTMWFSNSRYGQSHC